MALYKYHYIELDTKRSPRISLQNIVAGETGNRIVVTLKNDGTFVDLSTKEDGKYIYRIVLRVDSALGTRRQDSAVTGNGITILENGGDAGKASILLSKDSYTGGLNRCCLEIYSKRWTDNDTMICSSEFQFDAKGEKLGDNTGISEPLLAYWEKIAESWAHGGTGVRDGEDTDNAKYYSEMSSEIAIPSGSVTEQKLSNALKLKALNHYITPEMYGAKGDDETDDYAAIMNAVAAAYVSGLPLVFTPGKIYFTAYPIVIEESPKTILMHGALRYTGNGTALTIGKIPDPLSEDRHLLTMRTLKLNVIGPRSGEFNTGSCGVKLLNLNQADVSIFAIQKFETGLLCVGDTVGFGYNRIGITDILSCKIGVKLNARNDGWANENKFYGGRIHTYSTDSFRESTIGILITSENGYYNNANTFYSPSLESAGIAVKLEYAKYNRFYDARVEGCSRPLIALNNSQFNVMDVSYGLKNSDVQSMIGSNRYDDVGDLIVDQFRTTVFDSGDLTAACAKSGDIVSFAKLVEMRYASNTGHDFYPNINADADVSDGLVIGSGRMAGAVVDTLHNKTFLVSPVTDGTYRFGVLMLDANGDVIVSDAVYAHGTTTNARNAMSAIASGKYKDVHVLSANVSQCMYITVPTECVKAYFCVYARGSDCTLKRLIISARNAERYYSFGNDDYPVLSDAPTAAGMTGQFVKNASPSAGAIGWIYTGSAWVAV